MAMHKAVAGCLMLLASTQARSLDRTPAPVTAISSLPPHLLSPRHWNETRSTITAPPFTAPARPHPTDSLTRPAWNSTRPRPFGNESSSDTPSSLCKGATAHVRDAVLVTWCPYQVPFDVSVLVLNMADATAAYHYAIPNAIPLDLATDIFVTELVISALGGAGAYVTSTPPSLPTTAAVIYDRLPHLTSGGIYNIATLDPTNVITPYTISDFAAIVTSAPLVSADTAVVAYDMITVERPTPSYDQNGRYTCVTATETRTFAAAQTFVYDGPPLDNITFATGTLPENFTLDWNETSVTYGTWVATPTLLVEVVYGWAVPYSAHLPQLALPGISFDEPSALPTADSGADAGTATAVPVLGGHLAHGQASSSLVFVGNLGSSVLTFQVGPSLPTAPAALTTVIDGTIIVATPTVTVLPTASLSPENSPAMTRAVMTSANPAQSPIPTPDITAAPVNGEQTRPESGGSAAAGGDSATTSAMNNLANTASPVDTPAYTAPIDPTGDGLPATAPIVNIGSAELTPVAASTVYVAGQRLIPGGSPVTIDGQAYSVPPSADGVLVNGVFNPISIGSSAQLFHLAGQDVLVEPATAYTVAGQLLQAGGPPVYISDGTTLSLGPSALYVAKSGSTTLIGGTDSSATMTSDAPPALTIDGHVYTAMAGGDLPRYVIAGQTLYPGLAITATLGAGGEVVTVSLAADMDGATIISGGGQGQDGRGGAGGVRVTSVETLRTLKGVLPGGGKAVAASTTTSATRLSGMSSTDGSGATVQVTGTGTMTGKGSGLTTKATSTSTSAAGRTWHYSTLTVVGLFLLVVLST